MNDSNNYAIVLVHKNEMAVLLREVIIQAQDNTIHYQE